MKRKIFFSALVVALLISKMVQAQVNSIDEISKACKNFEKAIKEKDTALFSSIFISPKTLLSTFIRRPDSDEKRFFPLQNLTDFLGALSEPYYVDLSNIEVVVNRDIAYAIADSKEYYKGDYISFGKDMFICVNTELGWKIALLTSTATVISDGKTALLNYPTGSVFEVNQVIEQLFNGINSRDSSKIKPLIKPSSSLLILPNDNSNELKKANDIFPIETFINSVKSSAGLWRITKLASRIVDIDLCISEIQYEKRSNEKIIEKGIFYVSLFSEEPNVWKITSVVGQPISLN